MFRRKKKTVTPEQLGKGLHELIMRELSYFLDHAPSKAIITSFDLDSEGLGDELGFLGQFAALRAIEEVLPLGVEDVMQSLYQAFYKEIKTGGYPENELSQLDSYIQERLFHLTIIQANLSHKEFVKQIGEMAAITVCEKDTPPDELSSVFSMYYVGMYRKLRDLLSNYQLEGVERNTIEEVTSHLAVKIFKVSVLCAHLIEKDLEKEYKIDSVKYRKIALEFLFLFMHLADRDAFALFDGQKRALVIDSLYDYIVTISVNGAQYIAPKFETSIKIADRVFLQGFNIDEFNQRHQEYENYKKLFPEEEKGAKHTLFWEFSKHISEIVVGSTDDLDCRLMSTNTAVAAFKHLHLTGELAKILTK